MGTKITGARHKTLPRVIALLVTAALMAVAAAPVAAADGGVGPGTIELDLGPGASASVATTVSTPTVAPTPDIVFLADTTGSMQPALANVSQHIRSIAEQVLTSQPDARFGVAEYKEQRNSRRFHVNTPLSSDVNQLHYGVNDWLINVGGGGAPWTDFINAHFQIGDGAFAFRPSSTRIVAWFGGARSHDPSLGHTLQDAITLLQQEQVQVVAVPTDVGGDGLDTLGQASSITAGTSGVLMPATAADQAAQTLLDGIRSLDVTVTPEVTDCDSELDVSFEPIRRVVPSGTDARFSTTVTVRPEVADSTYGCTIDYLVNGRSVGFEQTITTTGGPDTTPPTITGTVSPAEPDGDQGWYVSAPTVSFHCSDTSGVASCSGPTVLESAATPQTVTGAAEDAAGNTAETTVSGLKVDLVDPVVDCAAAPSFVVGEPGQVTATVADAHSGPASPTASATADTSSTGSKTVRVTGTDVAGRAGTADCAYQVGKVPTTLVASPAALRSSSLLKFTLTPKATLTRTGSGEPLSGQRISFTARNRPVCSATTDSAGIATCTGQVPLLQVALISSYTATFAGTDTVAPATVRGSIR